VNEIGERANVRVIGTLKSEMGLIREAILMVASGYSSRVTVAGLTFGERLLRPARSLATEHGVRIVAQWSADEVGASLAVVRGGAAEIP
jgi:hypothetical protein